MARYELSNKSQFLQAVATTRFFFVFFLTQPTEATGYPVQPKAAHLDKGKV